MTEHQKAFFDTVLTKAMIVVAISVIGLASAGGAAAQSANRDNPTPLTSNDLAGEFHQDDPEYFYTFLAQPGDVTFTLDLKAKNYGGALYVTLYDGNGRELGAFDKLVMKGQSARVVKSVKFVKQQPVLMRIFSGNGEGYYRLRFGTGQAQDAVNQNSATQAIAQDPSAGPSTDRDNPTPLAAGDLTGDFHQDDPEYFYAFTTAPNSAITLTLDLAARNYGGALYITLFDRKGRELGAVDKVVMKGQTARAVKTIKFASPQFVIMRIFSGNGEGNYRLRVEGRADLQ